MGSETSHSIDFLSVQYRLNYETLPSRNIKALSCSGFTAPRFFHMLPKEQFQNVKKMIMLHQFNFTALNTMSRLWAHVPLH